jgi:hypothetical protein
MGLGVLAAGAVWASTPKRWAVVVVAVLGFVTGLVGLYDVIDIQSAGTDDVAVSIGIGLILTLVAGAAAFAVAVRTLTTTRTKRVAQATSADLESPMPATDSPQ